VLAEALLHRAAEHEVAGSNVTAFGTRYVIEGALQTPSGREPNVRVVWFVDRDSDTPRLVTAYLM